MTVRGWVSVRFSACSSSAFAIGHSPGVSWLDDPPGAQRGVGCVTVIVTGSFDSEIRSWEAAAIGVLLAEPRLPSLAPERPARRTAHRVRTTADRQASSASRAVQPRWARALGRVFDCTWHGRPSEMATPGFGQWSMSSPRCHSVVSSGRLARGRDLRALARRQRWLVAGICRPAPVPSSPACGD